MARSTARLAVAWAWTLLLTLGAAWMALAMIDLYGWLDAGVAILAALMITTCLWWLIHCQRGGDDE